MLAKALKHLDSKSESFQNVSIFPLQDRIEAVDAVTGAGHLERGSLFGGSDPECVAGVRRVCETKHETVCKTDHVKVPPAHTLTQFGGNFQSGALSFGHPQFGSNL